MPRKKGSKNKKRSTTKKENPLKNYKEDKKEKGDGIFDDDAKLDIATTEKIQEKEETIEELIEEPKVKEFNEKDLIMNSKKILNYTEGIKIMVDRSKGAGSKRDIPKILNHLKMIEDLSAGKSSIAGYVKTMQERTSVLKAIHIPKERIPVIQEIGKIADDLLNEIKPYARRRWLD